ncbi:550c662b-efad-46d6-ab8b-8dbd28fc5502-CDS [Sclerotinia trifoliorum]|uniref:550c662b-efad-46d6-ab8b-8dbd28fc5502-CDS n=1 Tax=Sclerotinia trifoliorum TaxID=28548 RepID=A0A8H2VT27_9HELO|nr:550c662b-efad-46d6-ab8b-8dbd28fc5502-CDS [Sclerotinia trifoliorum]
MLPQETCFTTHLRETVCAHLKLTEPTGPNSQPTNEVMQDDDYFALNDDDETLPTSAFQSSHTTPALTVDRDCDAQQVIKHPNNSANADTESILEGGQPRPIT